MFDFDIQRCSRRCAVTDRELKNGEACYSVLVPQGGEVVRLDYSAEAWPGPPANAIGWWQAPITDPNAGRPHWAPGDVMLDYFERLLVDPAAEDARYVLALLLVRRRIARIERTEEDAGRKQLVIYCPRNERQYIIAEAMPSAERAKQIQEQLAALLQVV